MTCDHSQFTWVVRVNRIITPLRYIADLQLKCADCGIPFRFKGLPTGLDLDGASMSPLGMEARLAVEPAVADNVASGKRGLSLVN